jgi:hypothetical protein
MGVSDVDKKRGREEEEVGLALTYIGVARLEFQMDHRLS